MNSQRVEALLPYAGRFGIFPVHPSGDLAKVPAGACLFPDLEGEARSRATGSLVIELRDRATTSEEVARWWGGRREYSAAVCCGDLQCLDFDDPSVIAAWVAILKEHGIEGLLERTARARTMSGGYHVWVRVPGCREESHHLARHPRPTMDPTRGKEVFARIETRGYGGYALVPPSEGYAWVSSLTLLDLPALTLEEFESLVVAATMLDEGPPEPRPQPREPRLRQDGAEESPNDWYERTASWDDLLVGDAGGTFLRALGHRLQYRRPGGGKRPSITTGNGRSGQDLAKVWTPNWPPFAQGETISKYYAYAKLHHDGDARAATRAIAAMPGYPGRPREPRSRPADDSEGDLDPSPIAKDLDVGAGFMRNDLGNARRLVHFHGADLRYCQEWGRFLHFDDSIWVQDSEDNARARLLAHDVSDGMLRSPDEETRKWGHKSQSSGALSSMLREVQPLVGVRSRDLDTHDHLLGVANGVLDLRTGRLVGNTRGLLITKRAATFWDPNAACPLLETFLRQIMRDRKDLVGLMLRVLGYCLTGSTREQKFFLFYGARGRNGKTTLVELMQALLGEDLCGPINKRLLTASDKDSARFAMAAIEGKRVVFANETTRAKAVDTEWIKEFAGGSTVQAERKGRDEYKFKPKAKLLHSVNAMPSADWSSSYGSRAVPIPFEQSWYRREDPNWREGDFEPDERLDEKLRAELPGILALLVNHGSVPWFEEGLVIPPAVATLLERYRMENDHLGHWMAERCKAGPSERVGMQEAFTDFRDFMKASGIPYRGRINDFQADVLARPGIEHKRPGNRSTIVGLSIRPEEYDAEDEG